MGVMTGSNTAGVDKEVATQALNAELQDNGRHYQLGPDRIIALDDLWSGLLCG